MNLHPGQPIRCNVRGRIFAAHVAVDGVIGSEVDIVPVQPTGKGAKINHFRIDRSDIEYARPAWTPEDALR